MKKYNKNMRIILLGALIATSTQMAITSYAEEVNNSQIEQEKSISQISNYATQSTTKVSNETELKKALENSNIKVVELKNNIQINSLSNSSDIQIKGNEKEIRGNGYTISSNGYPTLSLNTNTKIDNLKLNNLYIGGSSNKSLSIVNNSEISNAELSIDGNITLENVKINNIRMFSSANTVIRSSKIYNSIIIHSGNGELKIINTEIYGNHQSSGITFPNDNESNKAPIYTYGGSLELENVKITNPGNNAIYAAGNHSQNAQTQKIRIKGTLDIEGTTNEAILIKMEKGSNKNVPIELYIDGDIKQKGNTYTVVAENRENNIKVQYNNSKLDKGTDIFSNEYYNTKNREGNTPPFPSYNNSIAVVANKQMLLRALSDPNIKKIDIRGDIDVNSSYDEPFFIDIKGTEKDIKGNGFTISNSTGANWFNVDSDTKIDNLKVYKALINNEKRLDVVNNSELIDVSLNGNVSLYNVKMNSSSIYSDGNVIVNSCKLKNSNISTSNRDENKDGIVKIVNTEIDGLQSSYNAPICINGGNIELEDIKIINPGNHAVYAEGNYKLESKIRIIGTLEIEGAKKDAIVLKQGYNTSTAKPVELYIDGNIKQKGDTYTVKAEKEGTYTKVYYDKSKINRVMDKKSHVYYSTKDREGNEPQSIVYANKLFGEHAYNTAIKVSNEGWTSSYNVFLVNSNAMIDALSATPYARFENAPILLTEQNKLNSETKKEISRLQTKKVYIIGGEHVISNAVISELEAMNISVERISGKDRYETSLNIAKKIAETISPVPAIAVVNGITGIPDAVSIAPVVAQERIPIVLASPTAGTKIFDQYIKDNKVLKSYIIGREAAISNTIAKKLPNPERIGGIDRNETNAAILEKFYKNEELENIYVAKNGMKSSNDLIDALVVGPLAAKLDSPIVIVGNDLTNTQKKILSKKSPARITQVGQGGNENAFNSLANMYKD